MMGEACNKRRWHRSGHPRLGVLVLLGVAALLGCLHSAEAVTQLRPGSDAPAITVQDQSGREVSNAKLLGHVAVLVFGELYHDKTREACAVLDGILRDPRLAGEPIVPVLIVSQESGGEAAKTSADDRLPSTIARDPDRKTFGTYQVAAMPSIVVIDRQGKVVYAVAGLVPRLGDLLADSLLYASGKLSAENYQRTLLPPPASTQDSDPELRADRIAQLGRQLMRRGLDEMAAEKCQEALSLAPKHVGAHQDLGLLMLKHRRLAEAETQFRAVLAVRPDALDASLGLAFVQTLRGGGELNEAEKTVRAILARNPSQARAQYLLGLIQEQRGKAEDAEASFKKSAELLLERVETEEE